MVSEIAPGMVTCLGCGWVHFEEPMAEIKKRAQESKDWWVGLSVESRANYGGEEPSIERTLERLTKCFRCKGSYKNFRPSQPDDCPDGCTIQGILARAD